MTTTIFNVHHLACSSASDSVMTATINTTAPLRSRSSETSAFLSFQSATIHVPAPPLQICICEQQHQRSSSVIHRNAAPQQRAPAPAFRSHCSNAPHWNHCHSRSSKPATVQASTTTPRRKTLLEQSHREPPHWSRHNVGAATLSRIAKGGRRL